jgi:hypothetical protein
MNDFQHMNQPVVPARGYARSPLSAGRVDANPLFGRDSMVGIHWTCGETAVKTAFGKTSGKTFAKTFAKTWEGDSNTENEVASA